MGRALVLTSALLKVRGEAMQKHSLSSLLGDVELEDFRATSLDISYLHVKGAVQEQILDELLPKDVLNGLMNRLPLNGERYQVIKNGTVENVVPKYPQGGIDPGYIKSSFESGATLRITGANTLVPSLARFCNDLASLHRARVHANIYITPRMSSGFDPHFDDHDVFILQCYGKKCWSIHERYESKTELPLKGFLFNGKINAAGPATSEFELSRGDVLYIPRGQMHSARSTDDLSVHITFGFEWITVNEVVMSLLADSSLSCKDFRKSLTSVGAMGSDMKSLDSQVMAAYVRNLLVQHFKDQEIERVTEDLLNSWSDWHRDPPIIEII